MVEYIPGLKNILSDALLCLYAFDAPGTVCAPSEFTQYDKDNDLPMQLASFNISHPVQVGLEGVAVREQVVWRSPHGHHLSEPPESGRSETLREFSKRIHNVVLHSPRPAK